MEERLAKAASVLTNTENNLTDRFRALFVLKNLGGAAAIDAISKVFSDESALLKHECAYCLGQIRDPYAIDCLTTVLDDEQQDVMVRHEAGEALGAIGDERAVDILTKYKNDERPELSETCQIALDLIKWASSGEALPEGSVNPYASVDPAPPTAPKSPEELKADLLNTDLSLFQRYRALFALRNDGSEEAVLAIVAGLDDTSALFRHEIAYVLGQMQHPAAVEGLSKRLVIPEENYMVRHECAEALGAIATEECLPILQKYAKDSEQVVRESCEVALDMHAHETSGSFQYASVDE
eukprot:m.225252 g.225252  ORF g.225252 m.225252 type:complete len:296 (+) comp15157_c2_seq15:290-1177(+)